MKKLILILGLLTLSLNLFAFEFLGVEITGNVEEVADKLSEKGFKRKIGTIQEGSDKGKKAVVKIETALFLEGKYEGQDALLLLLTPDKDDIVKGINLSITKPSFPEIVAAWIIVSDTLKEKYGLPDIDLDTRQYPDIETDLLLLQEWQLKDVEITSQMPNNKYQILLSIYPL